jgi:uncharacterized membrane protein (UPF0127 family)
VSWLLNDEGSVLASLEIAETRPTRRRGLMGRDNFEGALLLRPARSVHTFGMAFTIDVALCDRDMTVLKFVTVPPRRLVLPVARAYCAIEAEAGSMARWNLSPGDQLEVSS